MKTERQSLKQMFSKFSVICTILPFLGNKKKWKYILLSLCKDSNRNWEENEQAFINLHSMVEWDYNHQICDLLRNTCLDTCPRLSSEFSLELDFDLNERGCIEFLETAKEYKIKQMRKLSMQCMDNMSFSTLRYTNCFFLEAMPPALQGITLDGVSRKDFFDIREGLARVLQTVQNKVFIEFFELEADSLKLIIENSINAQELVIEDCIIGDINDNFSLDSGIDYKLKSLDIYGTCSKSWKNYLDGPKLRTLVNAMSKTNLRTSLKKVHIDQDEFPKDEVATIFASKGFDVIINADNIRPEPLV